MLMLTLTQLDRRHEAKQEVTATSPAEGESYIMWGVNLTNSNNPPTSSKTPSTTTPALPTSNAANYRNVLTKQGNMYRWGLIS